MKPHWIIENIVKEESYLELSKAVEKAGFPILNIRGDFTYSMLDEYKREPKCVIFSGSIEMTKLIKQNLPDTCFPISYSNFDKYLCTRYYPYFGDYLFNDRYIMLPLKELNRQKWFIYEIFGKDALIFVRPDSGDKPFKAGLVDLQDFDRFFEYNEHYWNELIIVSTPKNILGEWRFVVSKYGDIIAQSSYRYQGMCTRIPSAPKGATELVKKLLQINYYPNSVFCMDIVQANDENFYLMELTSFSSAGLYACNKDKIVEEVSKIALQDYEEGNRFKLEE